jgi:WD40 repeat protein
LIGIRSEKTKEVREIHPTGLTWFRGLTWWPDASSFAVLGRDDKAREGIFRIDAITGAVTAIIYRLEEDNFNGNYGGFSFSPDARYMYFGKNGEIWERDLTLGTQRMILDRPSAGGPSGLSPDGRWFATVRQRVVSLVAPATGEVREILRLNSGETIVRPMPWTPDGRGIIVRKALRETGRSEIWLVSTVGKPPLKLDIDADRIPDGSWGRMVLHPDGKRLAFLAGEETMDVWVLENFQSSKRPTK